MTEELHNTPLIMVRWSRKHCAKLLSCSSLWAVEQERGKSHFKNAPLKSQTISQILYVIVLRGSQEQGLYIGRSPPESVSVCVCVCECVGGLQEQEIFCVGEKEPWTLHLLFCALPKRPEVKCQGEWRIPSCMPTDRVSGPGEGREQP